MLCSAPATRIDCTEAKVSPSIPVILPVASRAVVRYVRMRPLMRSAAATTTTSGANTSTVSRGSIPTRMMAATTASAAVPTMSTVHDSASSTWSTSSRYRVIMSPGDSWTASAPGLSYRFSSMLRRSRLEVRNEKCTSLSIPTTITMRRARP